MAMFHIAFLLIVPFAVTGVVLGGWNRGEVATSKERIAAALASLVCAALPLFLLRYGAYPFWQVAIPVIGSLVVVVCPVRPSVRRWVLVLSPLVALSLVIHFLSVSNSKDWMADDAYPKRLIEQLANAAIRIALNDVVAAGHVGKEYQRGPVDDVFPGVHGPHELILSRPQAVWHTPLSGLYRRDHERNRVIFKGGMVSEDIGKFGIASSSHD